ncbi:hypothetical protein NQ117_00815 [Paenibacillus sp. SC116]|uniref:hypothetical protein n=1 Tax=Paenibacillus sp. SC116 TaxID=2968986 RepID=UPI00215AD20E|nr:hypothetical protein [Paenibacillus sp. SC116]MCR8842215.1 hypothetical protein [Paenibacillus sp. SC116]
MLRRHEVLFNQLQTYRATESGMHTIAQVLVRTIYHEALHQSAMIYLRRFLR